jgi:hypothetical protein
MNVTAIKIVIFLSLVFNHNIFAKCDTSNDRTENHIYSLEDYYKKIRKYERQGIVAHCSDSVSSDYIEVNPRPIAGLSGYNVNEMAEQIIQILYPSHTLKGEIIRIDTDDDGTKETIKENYCKGVHEILKYDRKGDLVSSEREIYKGGNIIFSMFENWNKGKLVRIKYNNFTMNISQGKTPCVIELFGTKGKSFLHLEPENEPATLTQKNTVDSSDAYDAIKYYWHPYCKEYHEKQKSAEPLRDTISFNSDTESESTQYKYYIIIVIGIMSVMLVGIVIKYKRGKK